jgi:trans-aconitate methyltransferase
MINTSKWAEIWESRVHEPQKMTHLDLLRANGYDNARSTLYPWNLAHAQDYYWKLISLQDTESVYEVGCGSGAFLYSLYQDRHKVGGLDLSNSLIDLANLNLPGGKWEHGDALSLNVEEKWDHLVSFGLFFYFPDLDYAERVIMKMLEKANKSVCLYELPDFDRKDSCEQMRRDTTPNYDEDYKDLQHLYYNKQWFIELALKLNLHLTIFDQVVPDYENGKYRFCVILRKNM